LVSIESRIAMKLTTFFRTLLSGKRRMTCESCGNDFGCNFAGGCWCREVKVSDAARAKLREQYRECLCPNCLNQHAQPAPLQTPRSG
jgi:hypothetical protein